MCCSKWQAQTTPRLQGTAAEAGFTASSPGEMPTVIGYRTDATATAPQNNSESANRTSGQTAVGTSARRRVLKTPGVSAFTNRLSMNSAWPPSCGCVAEMVSASRASTTQADDYKALRVDVITGLYFTMYPIV